MPRTSQGALVPAGRVAPEIKVTSAARRMTVTTRAFLTATPLEADPSATSTTSAVRAPVAKVRSALLARFMDKRIDGEARPRIPQIGEIREKPLDRRTSVHGSGHVWQMAGFS